MCLTKRVKDVLQVVGQVAGEFHSPFLDRMDEDEACGRVST